MTTANEPKDTHTLFFYGTLLAPPVLYRVIFGSPRPDPAFHPSMKQLIFRSALLQNYRRHRVLDVDYPAILPEEGGNVRGTVVSGLTDGDRWRLDVFEGDQYERRTVRVHVLSDVKLDEAAHLNENGGWPVEETGRGNGEEETMEAETYVWRNRREELEEQEWDFEEFKRDKMRAWMGDGPSWTDDEEERTENANGVQIDEGFADVDRAVAEQEASMGKQNGSVKDPTGGRGVNGHITKQLKDAQKQGSVNEWNVRAW